MPLHDSAAAALDRYLTFRRRVRSKVEHLFIREDGRPLKYLDVYRAFQKLLKAAALWPPSGRRPRLHQLRHTFAVRALQASPAGRERIGQHMLALATYLGHVNIQETYWYLETTPELLYDIAVTGEAFFYGGQP